MVFQAITRRANPSNARKNAPIPNISGIDPPIESIYRIRGRNTNGNERADGTRAACLRVQNADTRRQAACVPTLAFTLALSYNPLSYDGQTLRHPSGTRAAQRGHRGYADDQ